MTELRRDDLIMAFHKWMAVTSDPHSRRFEDYLRHPGIMQVLSATIAPLLQVSEVTKARAEALRSPHWRALIKAHLARIEGEM